MPGIFSDYSTGGSRRLLSRLEGFQSLLGPVPIVAAAEFLDLLVLLRQACIHSLQMCLEFLGLALVVVQVVHVVAAIAIAAATQQQRRGQSVRECPRRSDLPLKAELVVLELGLFRLEVTDVVREELDPPLGHHRVLVGGIAFGNCVQEIGPHLGLDQFGLGGVFCVLRRFPDGLQEILQKKKKKFRRDEMRRRHKNENGGRSTVLHTPPKKHITGNCSTIRVRIDQTTHLYCFLRPLVRSLESLDFLLIPFQFAL